MKKTKSCARVEFSLPCHRVIGADAKLTGYAGGVDKKQWLLTWERDAMATEPDSLPRRR